MIFDSHAHLPSAPGATKRLLAIMDELGIDRAVVIPGGVVSPEVLNANQVSGGGVDVTPDNRRVAREAARSKGRLVPFFFANPHDADGPDAYDEAARLGRCAGLKLGPAVHGIGFDDPRIAMLFEVATAHRQPVYLHTLNRPGFRVIDAMVLAAQFLELDVIVGHAAGGHCEFGALDPISRVPRAHLETSGGFTSLVQAAVDTLGPERVLFGSEYPLQHPRAELAKLGCLGMDRETARLVLGGNMVRLLARAARDTAGVRLPAAGRGVA